MLVRFGEEIDLSKARHKIISLDCIDDYVPCSQGVYWIETNMPIALMQEAISNVTGKPKKVRKNPPTGIHLIEQNDNELFVAYSGTEVNINKRLKQHLFNMGNRGTAKLGCVIDENPFNNYQWYIGFSVIDSYELRYAVEAWWRLNKGWPKFCLR
jgi:hypothetical protein